MLEPALRIALLAAVKRTAAGELRADLTIAGRSVLGWQVALARELGCQRIICLCEATSDAHFALQNQTEAGGIEFHSIRTNAQLASLVRADDEFLMLLDGLVVDQDVIHGLIGAQAPLNKIIATFRESHPLAEGHPQDFERIDRERAWAGIAFLKASQIHMLADLPPDGDAMSLLLRLGLQVHTPTREVAGALADDRKFLLATDSAKVSDRQRELISASASPPVLAGPGRAGAALLVRKIAPRWLDKGPELSGLSGMAVMIAALTAAFAGFGIAGLVLGTFAAFLASVSSGWTDLRTRLLSGITHEKAIGVLNGIVDLALALMIIAVLYQSGSENAELALPILFVGLSRYLDQISGKQVAAFFRDRTLHFAIVALAAIAGALSEVSALLCLGALFPLLLRSIRQ